jgi:2-iminobutanoate/2-iminopropanoate deaminase
MIVEYVVVWQSNVNSPQFLKDSQMSARIQAADIACINATDLTPPAGHYSHVCVANGFAFISGQLPIDLAGNPLTDVPFETQAKLVLHNIDACLQAAGVTRERLVQVRVFVSDIGQWPIFNKLYSEWIGSHKPARAVAESSSLHYGSAVEVEAVALIQAN